MKLKLKTNTLNINNYETQTNSLRNHHNARNNNARFNRLNTFDVMETHLTIKELAPYLPYGLQLFHKEWKEILTMDCCGSRSDTLSIEDVKEYAKPILRPLSDHTKEIEVNGEKFVPTKALSMWSLESITVVSIPHIPVNLYELLLKWHFDIFGLIEKGLAIDKNTL